MEVQDLIFEKFINEVYVGVCCVIRINKNCSRNSFVGGCSFPVSCLVKTAYLSNLETNPLFNFIAKYFLISLIDLKCLEIIFAVSGFLRLIIIDQNIRPFVI